MALDIKILSSNKEEIELKESVEYDLSDLEVIGEEYADDKILVNDEIISAPSGITRIGGTLPSGFIMEEVDEDEMDSDDEEEDDEDDDL